MALGMRASKELRHAQSESILSGGRNSVPLVFFLARRNAVDFELPTIYPVAHLLSRSSQATSATAKPIWRLRTPAGTSLQAIAADDFNGDGKLDLVVTNVGDSSKNRFQESRDRRRAKP